MFGSAQSPTLKIAGSEQNAFLHFERDLVVVFWDVLGATRARLWRNCFLALCETIRLIRAHPLRMPRTDRQMFSNAVVTSLKLLRRLSVHAIPKEHLVAHFPGDYAVKSAPGMFGCWENESLNQTLKQVAGSSHRAIWAWRVLATAEFLLERYDSKKRKLLQA